MSTHLTPELLHKFIDEQVCVDITDNKREYIMITGTHGKKFFDEVVKKQVRIDFALRKIITARGMGVLTREEAYTIREMIHSPDLENLTVAESILKQKIKK